MLPYSYYKNMFMLLTIFISYSMIFMGLMQSPLLASVVLIVISMMMSLMISLLASKWMSYLIILLFLGGMMVLFVYICTLITNLKSFVKSYSMIIFFLFIPSIMISIFMFFQYSDLNFEFKHMLISILYLKSNFLLIMLCIMYLLLVLIISIKMSQKFKGGLKSKMYDI